MRISSSTLYDLGVTTLNNQLAATVKTQQQISTGKRILTPSDDPVASSRVVEIDNTQNVTNQHLENISTARSTLNLEETAVSNIIRVFQNARQTVVTAGNAALSSADRASLATVLRSNYDELLGIANARDNQGGDYLFSGYSTSTKPFSQTTGPGVYAGDSGQRQLQITATRLINISDTGQDLFQPGISGRDPFATIENFITALGNSSVTSQVTSAAGVANTGGASISVAVAASATPPQGVLTFTYDALAIPPQFSIASTNPTADVAWDGVTFPYTSNQVNTINGVSFIITDSPTAPNNGDTFTVQNVITPGTNLPIANQVSTGASASNVGNASLTTSVITGAIPPQAQVTLNYSSTPSPQITTVSTDPAWNGLTIPYVSGQTTTINGVSFTLTDGTTPLATGDSYTINNATDAALGGLDYALNNALRILSNIGSRQNELDSTQATNQDASLAAQTALSNLRDVDFAKAISDLTRQQNSLEASQKSFLAIQKLSLFNLL